MSVNSSEIPSISYNTLRLSPDGYGNGPYVLKEKIDSFKKNSSLYEYTKNNPLKSKVISIFDAALIIGVFVAGGLSAFIAATLLSGLIAFGVIIGIIALTGFLAMAIGFYFTYRWHGPIPNDIGTPFLMPFIGMIVPIWRSFTNSLKNDIEKDLESINDLEGVFEKYLNNIKSLYPETKELTKAKNELNAVHDYFWPDSELSTVV